MSHSDNHNLLTRRRFLKLGLATSALMVNWALPLDALAAPKKALPAQAPQNILVPPRKPRPPRLLMIDPGHGGRDPGAIGLSGTQEKDVVLDIARNLADSLSAIPGVTAKLTRESDVFLPLEERVRIGRDAQADMFLSIHADSAPNKGARGLSVYTLSEKASDDFSRLLADKENEADLMGGMDLPPADKEVTAILFDLASRRTRNTAQRAKANFVQLMSRNWHMLEQPMRAANFVVLRAPDVPSMLVETGFLSNPKDEQILREPLQRAKIAKLMARDLATILDGPLFG